MKSRILEGLALSPDPLVPISVFQRSAAQLPHEPFAAVCQT
jgi:hypothetical protein